MAGRGRRAPIIAACAFIAIFYLLFFYPTSEPTDFRKTTEAGLARKHGILRGDLSDEDLTAQTNRDLEAILEHEQGAKVAEVLGGPGTMKPTGVPSVESISSSSEEISVAGRKTMPKTGSKGSGSEKPKYPVDKVSDPNSDEEVALNGNKVTTAIDPGEEMAREELQSILKKSPIIIFSKSYCPYSKRAKALLLNTYTIKPEPYVVELDLMTEKVPKPKTSPTQDEDDEAPTPTLGRKLQDLLATLTGRKTVPNIMINAQSLGGADDVVRMDELGTLVEEIKRMGGKRIVSVDKKDS